MKRFKTPFVSRRNFVIIGVCSLALYGLSIGVYVLDSKLAQYHRQQAIKATQDKFHRLSKEEQAIHKADLYEKQMITSAQMSQRLLFDYLQRTYGLSRELSMSGTGIPAPDVSGASLSDTSYLVRIAYPDKVVRTAPKVNLEGAALTNVYAANCDNLSLPKNFWQAMQQNYEAGGYSLTHVALAFSFLKDNGCPLPENADALLQDVANGMARLADDPKTGADLRYEAVALLQFIGHRELVKPQWIGQIAREQSPDGSWTQRGSKVGTDHTTLLALWALLQYSRPNVPYQPLIRHPSS